MPSKYGFGNTRKKSPYRMGKAHYGMDQKNPIMKKETLPGIKREPVVKKPGDPKSEIEVKTDSSKLYGVDWKGYEPPVTEEDKK